MASTFNGKSLKLTHLFIAEFADGTVIKQDATDKSPNDPEGKKSQFWDVQEYEKTSPLIKFSLNHVGVMGLSLNYYSVDLRTGLFVINHGLVDLTDQTFLPTEPLRIVYFRETRAEKTVKTATMEVLNEEYYINRYFLGWQTTINGENYQRTIAINGR